MSLTLVVAGKIGPAFDGDARILCTSCRKDFITYKPGAMFGPRRLDFSARIFGTCDNCEDLRRHTANTYTELRNFFDEAEYSRRSARKNAPLGMIPTHGYAAGEDGAFTMCECPEGRECHNCK